MQIILLPTDYFLLTFTVAPSLRGFLRSHQRSGYGALFEASSESIKTLCADPKFSRADTPGFLGVLHTWGRELQFHSHIHYLVPGGALSSEDGAWHAPSSGFYLPVHALSRVFRAKFRDAIAQAGRARIELARGFNVRPPAPIAVPKAQPLRCPHCSAKLVYRRTILPHARQSQRIRTLIAHTVELSMTQALNSGP